MKVLVSGGTGLVGRYIVEELLAADYTVVVGGRHAPLPTLFPQPVAFVPLTLTLGSDQTAIFQGIDAFIHAAFSHVEGKYRGGEGNDPIGFQRLNVNGTISLFEAAKSADVRQCVFLSSRAVYGETSGEELLQETTEARPGTLYGKVKLVAERALLPLAAPDFVAAVLRATGVYGDLMPNKWDKLFADYLSGEAVPVRAGTEVHGRDLARAVILLLNAEPAAVSGQIFNLSDIRTDTHEIIRLLKAATGSPHPLPQPSSEGFTGEMDTAKIRALGWSGGGLPLFEETVRRLAAEIQTSRAAAAQSSS